MTRRLINFIFRGTTSVLIIIITYPVSAVVVTKLAGLAAILAQSVKKHEYYRRVICYSVFGLYHRLPDVSVTRQFKTHDYWFVRGTQARRHCTSDDLPTPDAPIMMLVCSRNCSVRSSRPMRCATLVNTAG